MSLRPKHTVGPTRQTSRVDRALIADALIEHAPEGGRQITDADLGQLLRTARVDRVLYRLYRARYGRTMRQIATVVGFKVEGHD